MVSRLSSLSNRGFHRSRILHRSRIPFSMRTYSLVYPLKDEGLTQKSIVVPYLRCQKKILFWLTFAILGEKLECSLFTNHNKSVPFRYPVRWTRIPGRSVRTRREPVHSPSLGPQLVVEPAHQCRRCRDRRPCAA